MRLTYETNMRDKKDRKLHSKYFSKDFYEKSQCEYWNKVYTDRYCNAFEHEYSHCYSESSKRYRDCDTRYKRIEQVDINSFLISNRKVRLIQRRKLKGKNDKKKIRKKISFSINESLIKWNDNQLI